MSVVLDNHHDPNYEPSPQEVEEYAKWLGMELPGKHDSLRWIARDGLRAPLPEDWKPCKSEKGELYYFNFRTGQSLWDHPMDSHFKELFAKEAAKLAAPVVRGSDDDDDEMAAASSSHEESKTSASAAGTKRSRSNSSTSASRSRKPSKGTVVNEEQRDTKKNDAAPSTAKGAPTVALATMDERTAATVSSSSQRRKKRSSSCAQAAAAGGGGGGPGLVRKSSSFTGLTEKPLADSPAIPMLAPDVEYATTAGILAEAAAEGKSEPTHGASSGEVLLPSPAVVVVGEKGDTTTDASLTPTNTSNGSSSGGSSSGAASSQQQQQQRTERASLLERPSSSLKGPAPLSSTTSSREESPQTDDTAGGSTTTTSSRSRKLAQLKGLKAGLLGGGNTKDASSTPSPEAADRASVAGSSAVLRPLKTLRGRSPPSPSRGAVPFGVAPLQSTALLAAAAATTTSTTTTTSGTSTPARTISPSPSPRGADEEGQRKAVAAAEAAHEQRLQKLQGDFDQRVRAHEAKLAAAYAATCAKLDEVHRARIAEYARSNKAEAERLQRESAKNAAALASAVQDHQLPQLLATFGAAVEAAQHELDNKLSAELLDGICSRVAQNVEQTKTEREEELRRDLDAQLKMVEANHTQQVEARRVELQQALERIAREGEAAIDAAKRSHAARLLAVGEEQCAEAETAAAREKLGRSALGVRRGSAVGTATDATSIEEEEVVVEAAADKRTLRPSTSGTPSHHRPVPAMTSSSSSMGIGLSTLSPDALRGFGSSSAEPQPTTLNDAATPADPVASSNDPAAAAAILEGYFAGPLSLSSSGSSPMSQQQQQQQQQAATSSPAAPADTSSSTPTPITTTSVVSLRGASLRDAVLEVVRGVLQQQLAEHHPQLQPHHHRQQRAVDAATGISPATKEAFLHPPQGPTDADADAAATPTPSESGVSPIRHRRRVAATNTSSTAPSLTGTVDPFVGGDPMASCAATAARPPSIASAMRTPAPPVVPPSLHEQRRLVAQQRTELTRARVFLEAQQSALARQRAALRSARSKWKRDVRAAKAAGLSASSHRAAVLRRVHDMLAEQADVANRDEAVLRETEGWVAQKQSWLERIAEMLAAADDDTQQAAQPQTHHHPHGSADGVVAPAETTAMLAAFLEFGPPPAVTGLDGTSTIAVVGGSTPARTVDARRSTERPYRDDAPSLPSPPSTVAVMSPEAWMASSVPPSRPAPSSAATARTRPASAGAAASPLTMLRPRDVNSIRSPQPAAALMGGGSGAKKHRHPMQDVTAGTHRHHRTGRHNQLPSPAAKAVPGSSPSGAAMQRSRSAPRSRSRTPTTLWAGGAVGGAGGGGSSSVANALDRIESQLAAVTHMVQRQGPPLPSTSLVKDAHQHHPQHRLEEDNADLRFGSSRQVALAAATSSAVTPSSAMALPYTRRPPLSVDFR